MRGELVFMVGPDLRQSRSRNTRTRPGPLAVLLALALGIAGSARAALIDLVVVGTWESANESTSINPFGFVDGDRFVMKATYDDTTLFNGAEGVTAAIDPSVNAGTSLEVIIPHAAGAPNPLVFTHADHTFIGFAPDAQIEFTGTDATVDPGVFRNFEMHVDFSFSGDDMDFDTFMGAIQTETDIFNISQGGDRAAVGAGVDHLQVVTNDVTANAGGLYVFDAFNLSLTLSGSSGGGSGFGKDFDWSDGGAALPGSPAASIDLTLAASGLTSSLGATLVDLHVTELYTDFSASASASVSYANTPPQIIAASATENANGSVTFDGSADDPDLAANAQVAGFESVELEFEHPAGNVFLTGPGTLDAATVTSIFGGPGTFDVHVTATDLAGAIDTEMAQLTVVVADSDGDGIEDDQDLCPHFASADQTDTDGNLRGDVCECGDQTGDGFVNVGDIIAINGAIFGLELASPLCDTNDDDLCNVADILGVNGRIFGAETYCSRYPAPEPKTVFITSELYTGALGGLLGADAICNSHASTAGLSGTYMAWLGTDAATPNTRFTRSAGAYVRTDGVRVAADYTDLTDGSLENSISVDEFGAEQAGGGAWSAADASGNLQALSDGRRCGEWTSGTSADQGFKGSLGAVDDTWARIVGTSFNCQFQPARLYCFEQ